MARMIVSTTGGGVPRARRKPKVKMSGLTDYDLQDTTTKKVADYLAKSGYRVEIWMKRTYPGSTIFTWWCTHNGGQTEAYYYWPKETAERVLGEWLEKAGAA